MPHGCDGFQGHVAGPLDGPLVVLLQEDGADQACYRLLVRKDSNEIGASLDLAVEAFEGVGRVELHPVFLGKGHVGQHVGFGLVHQGGELRHLGPDLIGDLAPLGLGRLGAVLGEGGADEGRNDAPALLVGVGQNVAHEMDPATLPSGVEYPRHRGLDAGMVVRDHQFDPAQAAARQRTQELNPEGLGFRGAGGHAQNLAPAVTVEADGDDHRHRDHPAVPAHFDIGGVEPDGGPITLQGPIEEARHLVGDFGAQPRHLALGNAGQAHGLDQIIDRAGRYALDIGLLDDGCQRLLGHMAGFQKAGEVVAALAQFRNAQLDRAATRWDPSIPTSQSR